MGRGVAHGIQFTVSGNAAGAYAPAVLGAIQPTVKVFGVEAKNTGTGAASVIIYDGSNTGPIVAAIAVPAAANAASGVGAVDFCVPRMALNGLVFEVLGTSAVIAATAWVE